MNIDLKELAAWLETKPAGEKYDYTNPHSCVLAQFLKSKFPEARVTVSPDDFGFKTLRPYRRESFPLDPHFDYIARGCLPITPERERPPNWNTFGAALARVKETLNVLV